MRKKQESSRIKWKGFVAMFLAVLMIVQMPLPYIETTAYASENVQETTDDVAVQQNQEEEVVDGTTSGAENTIQEDSISDTQTGGETTEVVQQETPAASENQTEIPTIAEEDKESPAETPEKESVAPKQEEKHEATEVTNVMSQLSLGFEKAWYQNGESKKILEEQEPVVDYTSIAEKVLKNDKDVITAGLNVIYRLTQNGEMRTVKGTDWMIVTFPEWMQNIRLTENAQEIRGGAGDNVFDGAVYEIDQKKHTLRITLKESIDADAMTDVHGKVGVTFDIAKSSLQDKIHETTVTLQKENDNKNEYIFRLPAKTIEDKKGGDTKSDEIKNKKSEKSDKKIDDKKASEQKTKDSDNGAVKALAANGVTPVANSYQNIYLYHQFYDGQGVHEFCDTSGLSVGFVLDGRTYNLKNDYAKLGLTEMPQIKTSATGTRNQYSVNVPTKINDNGTNKPVTWKFESNYVPDGYLAPTHDGEDYIGAENIYVFKKDAKVNFAVELLNKGEVRDLKTYDKFEEELELWNIVNGKETKLGTLADYQDKLKVTPVGEDENKNITRVTIAGLPLFNENDVEIIYYLKANSDKVKEDTTTGDYYEPSYDNTTTANFGSDTSRAYSSNDGTTGGMVALLLKGTTKYEAEKYWLDDKTDKTKRPDATLTLWRYSKIDENSNYTQAAQVYDADGKAYTFTLDKNKDYEEIVLGVTNGVNKLPKYDPYGHKYVYLTRESLSGGEGSYEQVFAESVTEDENHVVSAVTAQSRTDGDRSLYNGEKLANRITGSKSVKWKKVWNAGTYQTDLKKVSITLSLFQTDSNNHVVNLTNLQVKEGDFLPETLIRSGSASVPMYDSLGKPYTYEWKETNIAWDGKDLDTLPDSNVDGTVQGQSKTSEEAVDKFVLPHNVENSGEKSAGGKDVEYYESESTVNGDSTVITNTLKGKTTYTVDKLWAQVEIDENGTAKKDDDGNYVLQKDKDGNTIFGKELLADLKENAYVNIYLQKNGTKLADSDVTIRENSADISGAITGNVIAGRVWTFEYTDLDKYDAGGYPIAYTGKEDLSEPNWHSTPAYNVTTDNMFFNMQMKNAPNPGNPSIKIRKDWKDAGDRVRRGDVVVDIYGTKKNDGTKAELIDEVTLTEANEWYLETQTKKNLSDYKDIYVREKAIVQDKKTYKVSGDTKKPVYYDFGTGKDNATGEAATVDTVSTKYHNYEVSYSYDNQAGEYIIMNRRVGAVQIDAKKIWKDDSNKKNYRKNLDAQIKLIADNDDGYSEDAITIDTAAVSVKNVLKNSADAGRQVTDNNAKDVETAQKVTGVADKDGNEMYYFYNLPKYDSEGRVIHYSLKEEMVNKDGTACEYISEITRTGYSNNDGKDNQNTSMSTQTMNVTNTLSATKSVVFYKEWKDKYVNETLNKRPDIYMTLYRKAGENGTLEEVKPYVDRVWAPHRDDTSYHWKWEFDNLPKYDSNGVEYTYYATEGCNQVTMERYHYQKVELEPAAGDKVYTKGGVDYLPENGTFVNRIAKTVVINGKKVWKNIPTGTAKEDLPQITVNVYQTTKKAEADDPKWPANQSTDVQNNAFVGQVSPKSSEYAADYTWGFTLSQYTDKNGKLLTNEDGSKKTLPQYSADGEIYYYAVRESVESGETLDTAYEALPGEVNNYIITNTYDVNKKNNQGQIQVTKKWDGFNNAASVVSGWEHPKTTYTLYRYYISKKDNIKTTAEKVEEKTLVKASSDTEQTLTFENLRLYAPNGNPYLYYVVEKNQDGYTIQYTTTITTSGGTKTESGTAGTNQSADMELASATKNSGKYEATVTYTNTYTPGETSISGSKEWDDFNNATSTRPDKDTFLKNLHLYRYAKAQGGDGAAEIGYQEVKLVTSGNGTAPYATFTWGSEADNAQTWTFTIKGLQDYAPNGSRWEYVLAEGDVLDTTTGKINPTTGDMIWNYKGVATQVNSEGKHATENSKNVIKLDALKNSIKKSASITKIWQAQEDNIRPSSITVELQFKIGDSANTWLDATQNNLALKGINITLTNNEGSYVVKANENWTKTVSDLPALVNDNGTNKQLHWRFVETKIGNASVLLAEGKKSSDNDITYAKTVNGYTPKQTSNPNENDDLTATDNSKITNTFDASDRTQLKITKIWASDSADLYGSRPKDSSGKWSITVQLEQKKKDDTTDTWKEVKNTSNQTVTRTIIGTADQNNNSVTFGNLPKYDDEGKELEYRAVELNKDKLKANGYNDIKEVGTTESTDQTTTITNTLSPTITLTVSKKWENVENATLPKIAVEVIRIKEGEEVHFDNGTDHSKYTQILDSNAETKTVTFTGLPKFNGYTYAVKEYAVNADGTVDYSRPVTNGYYKASVYTEATRETEDTDNDNVIKQTTELQNIRTEFTLDKKAENGADFTNDYTVTYDVYVNSVSGANKVFTWTKTKSGDAVTESVTKTINDSSSVAAKNAAENLEEFKDKDASKNVNAIKGLALGTYVLRETKAPEGYELAGDTTFTLGSKVSTATENDDITIKKTGTAGAVVTSSNDGIVLYDTAINLSLTKTDINASKQTTIESEEDKAEFTIAGTFADKKTEKTGITSANIQTLKELWIAGQTYTVTETKAPKGYELAPTFTFVVNAKGTITNISTGAQATGSGEKLTVKDRKINVDIRKVSTAKFGDVDPEALTGDYRFEVTPVEGSAFAGNALAIEVTQSTKNPLEGKLVAGNKYKVTETKAPDGYELAKDFYMEVSADGKVTLSADKNADVTEYAKVISADTDNTVLIAVADEPIQIRIKKIDSADSNVILENAVYELTDETTNTTVQFTNDNQEHATFIDMKDAAKVITMVQGHKYSLKEVKAPAGYEVPVDNTVEFTVETNGELTFTNGDIYSGNGTATITAKNTKTSFTLKKVDNEKAEENSEIADDSLELTIADENKEAVFSWKHQADEIYQLTKVSQNEIYKELAIDATTGLISGLPTGTYTVSETSTPSGYLTIADFTLKVAKDGTVSAEKLNGKTLSVKTNTDTVTITDTVIRGAVKLTKVLGNDTLKNVTFALYRVNGTMDTVPGTAADNDAADTLIAEGLKTDENGIWTSEGNSGKYKDVGETEANTEFSKGFRSGAYYFVETSATADSTLDAAPLSFTIPSVGTTQPELAEVTKVNEAFTSSITLKKVDAEDDQPISGDVKFNLKWKDNAGNEPGITNNLYKGEGVTKSIDTNGELTFEGLTKGTYTLKEVSAKGYEPEFEKEITIEEANYNQTIVIEDESGSGSIKNNRLTGSVVLTKKDSKDSDLKVDAEFKLQQKDAVGEYQDVMTGLKTKNSYKYNDPTTAANKETGVLEVTGLPWGEYRFVETSPADGYSMTSDDQGNPVSVEFTVNRDTFKNDPDKSDTIKVDVSDVQTKLTIVKQGTDEATGKKMQNAEFTIEGSKFANADAYKLKNNTITVTTDTNGEVTLKGVLVANVEYTLKEKKAPTGYELNPEVMKFKLNADGRAEIIAEDASAENPSGYTLTERGYFANTITAKDTPIEVQFEKTDKDTNAQLAGAEFRLEDLGKEEPDADTVAEEAKTITFVMKNDKCSSFADKEDASKKITMTQGHYYRLTELKAPSGYVLPEESNAKLIFQIQTDGTLKFTETSIYSGNNSETLTAKNTKTEFKLSKKDNESQAEIADENLELSVKSGKDTIFTWKHGKDETGKDVYSLTGLAENSTLSINAETGVVKGLQAGTYTVSETATPYGYLQIKPFTFTIDEYGVMTREEAAKNYADVSKTADKVQTLEITDTVIRGHVSLTKTLAGAGEDANKLQGVVFDLYRVNGQKDETPGIAGADGDAADIKIATDLTTDKNGNWTSKENSTDKYTDVDGKEKTFVTGLVSGDYYFVETKATADSKLDATSIPFTIAGAGQQIEAGNVTSGTTQPKIVKAVNEAGRTENVVANTVFTSSVKLTKYDATSKTPINGGVWFKLQWVSDESDNTTYAHGVTENPYKDGVTKEIGADGTLTFENLLKGTYTLTETEATGYEVSFAATIVIGENDYGRTVEITAQDDHTTRTDGNWYQQETAEGTVWGIANTRLLGTVTLHKVSGEDNTSLNGVEFALQKKNAEGNYITCMTGLYTGMAYTFADKSGEAIQTAPEGTKITDGDGTLKIKGIPWDTYRLVELTPADGYSDTDQVVTANGEMAVAVASQDFTIERTVREIDLAKRDGNLVNYQIKLAIKKESTKSTEALKGAEFTITGDKFARGNVKATNGKVVVTTDDNGLLELNGVLVAGVEYTLQETKAPKGYELITDPVTLMVEKDGRVLIQNGTAEENEEGYTIVSGFFQNTITAKDTPIEVTFTKKDLNNLDGNALTGARFKLEDLGTDGNSTEKEIEFVMDNVAHSTFTDVAGNTITMTQGHTYKLTELVAPAGYQLPEGDVASLTFVVDKDGNLNFKEKTGYIGAGTESIVVSNEKTAFTLKKFDNESGKEIANAELKLAVADATGETMFTWSHTSAGYALEDMTDKYSTIVCDNESGEIRGLPEGTYTVSETGTPYGYLQIKPFTFTIHATGTMSVNKSAADYAEVSDATSKAAVLKVTDTIIRGHVSLTKTLAGEDANKLQGVVFDLYRVNGQKDETPGIAGADGDAADVKIATSLTTDENGNWTSKENSTDKYTDVDGKEKTFATGLVIGDYYFVETRASADSKLDVTPIPFTIAGAGQQIEADNVTGGTAQPEVVNVNKVNGTFASNITLTKYDATSNTPINGGVWFRLQWVSDEADNTTYAHGVTENPYKDGVTKEIGADGTLQFENLLKGTYTLTEVSAWGYDTSNPFTKTIVIGEDNNGQTITFDTITNERLLPEVTLTKSDADSLDKLADVTFTLQKKDDTGVYKDVMVDLKTGKKYTLGADTSEKTDKGTIKVASLTWGDYRFVETDPEKGYSLADSDGATVMAEFTVSRDTFSQDKDSFNHNQLAQIDLTDAKTKLTLKKQGVDGVTGEAMKDAEFTVTGAEFVKTAQCKPTQNADGTYTAIVKTDDNGELTLEGALIAGVEYTIEETKAPLGYERITDPVTIKVKKDGSMQVVSGAAENSTEGYMLTSGYSENVLTATDTPIEVKLAKTDREGNALTGAEFTVSGEFADGQTEIKATDDNFENALKAKLIASTDDKTYIYKLHEEKAPDGYERMNDIFFTVNEDGEIVKVAATENGIKTDGETTPDYIKIVSENGVDTLTFEDDAIVLDLTKRLIGDTVETGMENAEFTITGEKLVQSGAYAPEDNGDGTFSLKVTTGEDGILTLDHVLVAGVTYTLTETKAPEGAMSVEEETKSRFRFTFTVDEHGKVTDVETTSKSADPYLTYTEQDNNSEANDLITVWDVPTSLIIYKKGTDTKGTEADNFLKNCKFAITGRFAKARYEINETVETETPSGDRDEIETIYVTTNGNDTLENALKGRLIVGETYTIKEVNAPSGYELGTAITFTVTGTKIATNGSMVLKLEMKAGDENNGYEIAYDEDGNPYIQQRDLPVELKLKKVSQDGKVLAGASFKITGIFEGEEDESSRTYISDKEGYIDLTKQINECTSNDDYTYVYKLEETKAPSGYDKLDGVIYFRMVSTEQGETRVSKVEVLYGNEQTSTAMKKMLTAKADSDVEILQIQNNVTPVKATTTNKKNDIKKNDVKKNKSAKTGDASDIAWYLMMLLSAGMIGCGTAVYSRRRRKE